ncbi:histone deacetylase clr3 [Patellaria atrata CBS 101060]|uniref:Histone deacetylase n=1 Tax=Patellaria atrata CBS 101060 TaxID=1346257 RepID=A0A9P4SCZ8_9PEZI|nr:histone deacetylase clr3 [Patellaria atrata CBS 101060]
MKSSSSDSEEEHEVLDYVRQPSPEVVIPTSRSVKLPYTSSRSGLVYDVRMRFHAEIVSEYADATDVHPEDPRRILEIYEELLHAGLIEEDPAEPGTAHEYTLKRLQAREATGAEICLVHSKRHFKWVRDLESMTRDELVDLGNQMDSLYLHGSTFFCARLSAGGAIEACRAVVTGHVKNSIAVIRPPGHHAEPKKPGGFCLFNNVSIAARVCQADYPDLCRKVLILDWDVHHGNGVQEAFYDDPNVLYISLHVHKDGTFYPTGPTGNHTYCGGPSAIGKNVNIPWSRHGMGDGDYMLAFQTIIMPVAMEFDPDLVIISAGFDAAEGDTLGGCHVSPACYAHMTHMLMSLAHGKVAVCLEGGYNLRSIAKSALAVTRTLMGEPPDRLENLIATDSGAEVIDLVIKQQSRFWKCLYPKTESRAVVKGNPIHDILREWQSMLLGSEYNMSELFILREEISPSFSKQVLATENYAHSGPLLVIVHDPPQANGQAHHRTGLLDLHNTHLADETKTYIDWACTHGFAVIDVNIPKQITGLEDPSVSEESAEKHTQLSRDLLQYIWENYIEINDSQQIFMMGVGAAGAHVLHLLSSNEEIMDRVAHVINFVADNALLAVRRQTDDASAWYWRNSHVFVANSHLAWDPERKKRKKYGNIIKSPYDGINDMLYAHRHDVTTFLDQSTQEWQKGQTEQQRRKRKELNSNLLNASTHLQEITSTSDERSGLRSPGGPPIGMFGVSAGPFGGVRQQGLGGGREIK